MIVELDDTVFDFPDEDKRRWLSALIQYSSQLGHHVAHTRGEPLPEGSRAHDTLVKNPVFDLGERAWILEHLRQGFEAAQRPNASRRVVRVHTGATDWSQNPPVLSRDDAQRYVVQPVVVIVENKENDRRFLSSWVPASRSSELAECQRRETLEYEHGGGLSGISKRINAASSDGDASFLHRAVALFDSDAMQPNKPSSSAIDCRRLCRKHLNKPFSRFHMLERRAIENYFSHDLVESYATSDQGSHVHADAVSTLRALGITSTYAVHYHMKKGLLVDFAGRSEEAKNRRKVYEENTQQAWKHDDRNHLPAHWRQRAEAELSALLRGFSAGLASWCLDKLAAGHPHTFDAQAEKEGELVIQTILDWV